MEYTNIPFRYNNISFYKERPDGIFELEICKFYMMEFDDVFETGMCHFYMKPLEDILELDHI